MQKYDRQLCVFHYESFIVVRTFFSKTFKVMQNYIPPNEHYANGFTVIVNESIGVTDRS